MEHMLFQIPMDLHGVKFAATPPRHNFGAPPRVPHGAKCCPVPTVNGAGPRGARYRGEFCHSNIVWRTRIVCIMLGYCNRLKNNTMNLLIA
jgi:hypothetical protein